MHPTDESSSPSLSQTYTPRITSCFYSKHTHACIYIHYQYACSFRGADAYDDFDQEEPEPVEDEAGLYGDGMGEERVDVLGEVNTRKIKP